MAYKFNPFTGTLDDTIPVPSPLEITHATEPQLKLTNVSGEYATMEVEDSGALTIKTFSAGSYDDVGIDFGRYFLLKKNGSSVFSFAYSGGDAKLYSGVDMLLSTTASSTDITINPKRYPIVLADGDPYVPSADDHIANKKYVDDAASGAHDHEGTAVLSTGPVTDGHVLTAVGDGSAAWEAIPAGSGEANEYSFKTISILGQDDVVADSTTDTLTLVAGSGTSLVTLGDQITITSTPHVHAGATNTAVGITDGYVLTADGADGTAWEAVPGGGGGISNIVEDTTPQLGGNLDINGKDIEFASHTIDDCISGNPVSFASAAALTNIVDSFTIKGYVDETVTNIADSVNTKRFGVSCFQQNSRMGLINNWYMYNQGFGTTIAAIDWATFKFNTALYTSNTEVTLKAWSTVFEFSSSTDYEIELWDLTIPDDGAVGALTAAKVGDTQTVSATQWCIYTIGQDDLDYTLAAKHQLYLLKRYTSGSGNKYTYESTSLEFEVI
tara:strand:+ start:445 stop:1938 length:1494 start_codon:yes stop_codon:yes gene_type:complete